jgi:hypothetical protein
MCVDFPRQHIHLRLQLSNAAFQRFSTAIGLSFKIVDFGGEILSLLD